MRKMFKFLKEARDGIREAKRERSLHNDMDYQCVYWWGDRGGYGSVFKQKCLKCRYDRLQVCHTHVHKLWEKCPNGLTKFTYVDELNWEERYTQRG